MGIDLIELHSTVVIVIGAIILFLGVRRGETRVEEFNVTSHYYSGILVITNYILEPYAVISFVKYIMEIYFTNFFDHFWTFIPYVLLLVVESILLLLVQLSKKQIRDKHNSRLNFKDTNKNNTFNWLKNRVKNRLLSWSVPSILILILYSFYKLNVPLEIKLTSFILAVLIFIDFMYCVEYNEVRYTEAVLYINNGKTIKGIILKRGPYINILTENGTCSIKKDDVNTIKVGKNSKELYCDSFPDVHKKLASLHEKLTLFFSKYCKKEKHSFCRQLSKKDCE